MTPRDVPTTVPLLPADPDPGPESEPVAAGVLDTLRTFGTVVAPVVLTGVIKRRPRMVGLAAALQLDRFALATMRHLRDRYGERPVLLKVPGRIVEVPVRAEDAGRVLAATPDPFTPATLEKRGALGHFQPHGVLITKGPERAARRTFTEAVLEPSRPLHALAPRFVTVVREESQRMLEGGELDWDRFAESTWYAIRRIVLGDRARADVQLSALLDSLRRNANWSALHPRRPKRQDALMRRLAAYVAAAEPGSLAAVVAETPAEPEVDPVGQLPQWLFAFDAMVMATFRALALLATHPAQAATARAELAGLDLGEPQQLPYLRACVLESVRLWPTTPIVLRESTRDTAWGARGTTQLLFTPFFHREAAGSTFDPDLWLDGRAAADPALVPFSAGPAQCPGRNVVLLTASTLLAAVLEHHEFALAGKPVLARDRPVPATVDNFGLRFTVRAAG